MGATIPQIIGKANPGLYAENGKELLKKYKSIDKIPADEVAPKNLAEHKIVYNSAGETLEPIYFYLVDLIGDDFGMKIEKLADNFSSSPGSGHFGEMGQRGSIMQQQGTKILADINTVLRSTLNIIHDLKDFKTRLNIYEDLKSKNKETASAAELSLKQIWMDKVDITKGNSSIKAMALGQAGFVTLMDAFLASNDEKHANTLDLNERVKRIVIARIHEFNDWLKLSEKELKKRYALERSYLKSQVNNLKLYARWAKPYLKAAAELENADMSTNPGLVKVFNTLLLKLTLLCSSKLNVKNAALEGNFPADFAALKTKRDYFKVILVDFDFRGIPQKISQRGDYTFGGKTVITFSAYALNSEELEIVRKESENESLGEVFEINKSMLEGYDNLKEEIQLFLDEEEKETKEQKKSTKDQSNPFIALIGGYEKKSSSGKKNGKKNGKKKEIKKDNWIEENYLRRLMSEEAIDTAFTLHDVYKKSHGMVSYT